MSRAATIAAAVATVVTLSALTSCAHADQRAELDLPRHNRSEWVLPLDSYMMNEQQISTMQYAWTLLSVRCMADRGFSLDMPGRPQSPLSDSESWNAVGRFLFTSGTAARFGYHVAPTTDTALAAEWYDFTHSTYSEGERTALPPCQKSAWAQLPDMQNQDDVMADFAAQASGEAQQSDDLEAAAKKWRSCMSSIGVSDLPSSPEDMPSSSQLDALGLAGGNEGSLSASASQTELSQATADADCRESTRYDEILYEAEWDAQVRLMQANLDEITRGREMIESFTDGALEVIAENAPSA